MAFSFRNALQHRVRGNLHGPPVSAKQHEEKKEPMLPDYANVPITQTRQHGNSSQLVPTSRVSVPSLFGKYEHFNAVQSKCFDAVYKSDTNIVVSAPTGSGKTLLLELAMLRYFEPLIDKATGKIHRITNDGAYQHRQAVYVAPLKALVSEMADEWRKFQMLGINTTLFTGDSEVADYQRVRTAHIVLTTPEKWDSLTTNWKKNKSIANRCGLLLVDEVHMLGDEGRGGTLEGLVSRMMLVQRQTAAATTNKPVPPIANLRVIALSATIENHADIATWLHGTSLCFGEEYRPLPLQYEVRGYYQPPNKKSAFMFANTLNYKLFDLLRECSEGKPSIVFCATRKETAKCASLILERLQQDNNPHCFIYSSAHREALVEAARKVAKFDRKLASCVAHGIGYHSGGMQYAARQVLEDEFRNGNISVICTTSTLAQGVNLPAHLVVIKGVDQYTGDGYVKYNRHTICQMIGRAGRPQFNTEYGRAVVMCADDDVSTYMGIHERVELCESKIRERLVEHLNTEFCRGNVRDEADALLWIKSTFFYVRCMRSPQLYGMPHNADAATVERELVALCLREMQRLARANMIAPLPDDCGYYSTALGNLMTKGYLSFETCAKFAEIPEHGDLKQMLEFVCSTDNVSGQLRFNSGDKKILNGHNKGMKNKAANTVADKVTGEDARYPMIDYPLKGKVKTVAEKAEILAQIRFGRIAENGLSFSMTQEIKKLMEHGIRVTKCVKNYLENSLFEPGASFTAYRSALLLLRCFQCEMWPGPQHCLLQLPSVGPVISKNLRAGGVVTIQDILKSPVAKIDRLARRKIGQQVLDAAKKLPVYEISVALPKSSSALATLTVRQTNPAVSVTKHKADVAVMAFVARTDTCHLLKHIRPTSNQLQDWSWPIPGLSLGNVVTVDVVQTCYVGMDKRSTFVFTGTPQQQQRQPQQIPQTVAQAPPPSTASHYPRQSFDGESFYAPPPLPMAQDVMQYRYLPQQQQQQQPYEQQQQPHQPYQPYQQMQPPPVPQQPLQSSNVEASVPIDLQQFIYIPDDAMHSDAPSKRKTQKAKGNAFGKRKQPPSSSRTASHGSATNKRRTHLPPSGNRNETNQTDLMMKQRVQQSGMSHLKPLRVNRPAFSMLPANTGRSNPSSSASSSFSSTSLSSNSSETSSMSAGIPSNAFDFCGAFS